MDQRRLFLFFVLYMFLSPLFNQYINRCVSILVAVHFGSQNGLESEISLQVKTHRNWKLVTFLLQLPSRQYGAQLKPFIVRFIAVNRTISVLKSSKKVGQTAEFCLVPCSAVSRSTKVEQFDHIYVISGKKSKIFA